jgi:DNA invertase Pin-like site-specific DNA recombinase
MLESDAGHSSILKLEERSGLSKILNCIWQDAVFLSCSVTDVGRTYVEFIDIEEEVRKRGGHFVSISEGYDTNSPSGLSHMQISCSYNRFLRIQKLKRIDWKYEEIPYGWTSIREEEDVIYED